MSDSAIVGSPPAPVGSSERVSELDVLRGFALLGVLLVHCYSWPAPPFLTTEAQFEAVASSWQDQWAGFLTQWLFYDKANTLFAFLFGVGFWVQMERMEARGGNFRAIYLRRLTILLAFGLLHLFTIWPFDILHLYALAGFALFALRKSSGRVLLIGGIILALGARPMFDLLFEAIGVSGPAFDLAYSDAAIMERQNVGSFGELVAVFAWLPAVDFIASGMIVGWFFYALGRFMLGAYVARQGWLQRAAQLLPRYRFWLLVTLPLGLAGEFVAASLEFGSFAVLEPFVAAEGPLHTVSAPLLAVGYVCAIVLLFHSRLSAVVRVFAPVGRMALTNYVMQGVALGFVLYKFDPALGLIGRIGPASLMAIGFVIFAAQILVSHLWLSRFAYGPLEWGWRALTYGGRPPMRLASEAARPPLPGS